MSSSSDPAGVAGVDAPDDGSGLIGQVIDGRYRLESILGSGGMGVVYRAAHVGLRRQVAVKILQPALAASPDVRSRFEREALAIGKIDHPNCVGVYDVGRLPDGSLYLAMELLEGRALAHVIEAEGQLAPGRALAILAHVLRGLGHVHAAGLVHRDMKPENIFLVTQGDDHDFAKILDFGIAKPMAASELDDGVRLTQAGMAFGTPIYMAPEQALGNPLDGRADLYAASVLAYEMLCGQPPFYSDDKLEVMSMHTARPVPPMRQRLVKNGQAVPSEIEALIARGLTKRPAERYATAAAYLAEVEAAIARVRVAERRGTVVTTGSQPLVTETDGTQLAQLSDDAATAISSLDDAGSAEAAIDALDAIDSLDGLDEPPRPLRDRQGSIGAAIDDALATAPSAPNVASGSTGPIATGASAIVPTFRPPAPTSLSGFKGVGIGLPHTGPGGVAVFTPGRVAGGGADSGEVVAVGAPPLGASTPMPRGATATPRLRPRWPIYAAGIGVAAVIGIAIAVVTSSHGAATAGPSTPAGIATEALERGDPARAIQVLEAQKAAIEQDAQAQLVLGRAHAARHESAPALAAYAKALQLAPELESDAALRANLAAMADDKDPTTIAGAFDLWVGHTHDAQARAAIAKAAVSETIERRKAVRAAIDHYKVGDGIDWLASYSLDLEQEVGCERRKDAVAKLRALGDPRAAPALERAVVRRGKTGAYKGKAINACLVDDANAAIEYLHGLPGGGGAGDGSGSGGGDSGGGTPGSGTRVGSGA